MPLNLLITQWRIVLVCDPEDILGTLSQCCNLGGMDADVTGHKGLAEGREQAGAVRSMYLQYRLLFALILSKYDTPLVMEMFLMAGAAEGDRLMD